MAQTIQQTAQTRRDMTPDKVVEPIDWSYPQPRGGLWGSVDRFFGPGTTQGEWWIQTVFVVGMTIGLSMIIWSMNLVWTVWQYAFALLAAFDLSGGIVTNATSSAKRWYHRAGQGLREHMGFIAIHVAYFLLVAVLFRHNDWLYFAAFSIYLLGTSFLVLKLPLYLHRPAAYCLYAVAILVSMYVFQPTRGLEWFIPFIFLKLLVSHLVREEPYRPRGEAQIS